MSGRSVHRLGAALSAWIAMPGVALACPVCFVAQSEENRLAYVVSSVGLTLLPFVVVGGIVFWAWRRVRAGDAALAERTAERLD